MDIRHCMLIQLAEFGETSFWRRSFWAEQRPLQEVEDVESRVRGGARVLMSFDLEIPWCLHGQGTMRAEPSRLIAHHRCTTLAVV